MAAMDVNDDPPTHVLVQQQLEDVVRTQQIALDKLKLSVTSGKTPTTTGAEYDVVFQLLEEEKRSHASTQRHLREVEDKLSYALGEVELLTRQLEREKRQFDETFGNLKNKALSETVRNVQLENKCNVIAHQHEVQSDTLAEREVAITTLTETVQSQRNDFSHMLSELDVQRRQQKYIARVLGKVNDTRTAGRRDKFGT